MRLFLPPRNRISARKPQQMDKLHEIETLTTILFLNSTTPMSQGEGRNARPASTGRGVRHRVCECHASNVRVELQVKTPHNIPFAFDSAQADSGDITRHEDKDPSSQRRQVAQEGRLLPGRQG